MQCASITFSRHAVQRMFQRDLSADDIEVIVASGLVIEDHPSDFPHPSCLLLGYADGRGVHVVAARDAVTGTCIEVTVYEPDVSRWWDDLTMRKTT